MQPLERDGYTASQVATALHASNRLIAFRYEVLDSKNSFKKHLTNILGASVSYQAFNDIKRTAKFSIQEVDTGEEETVNLVHNPVPTSTDGWSLTTGASYEANSFKVEASVLNHSPQVTNPSKKIPIDVNKPMTFSLDAEVVSWSKGSFYCSVYFYDSSGTWITNQPIMSIGSVKSKTRYTKSYGPGTANAWPTNTASVLLIANWWNSTVDSVGIGYASNFQAEVKPYATNFVVGMRTAGEINFLSDRIKPWVRLKMADGGYAEFPLGVFLLSTPTRKSGPTSAITRDVEAYDQLQILRDDRVTGRFLIAAGTNFISAVKSILDGAGITLQNLTTTTITLPVDREWDGGTPKLEIINDLLEALNYEALYFDENGYAVAKPYISPNLRASEYLYKTDESSVIIPGAEETLDLFNVPNQWVLTVSEPDRAPLRSVYTNENPDSLTSTVSRGRTIVDYRQVDAADQATLDGLAQKAAYQASQVYQNVNLPTGIMPHHSHNDIITLEHSKLGISAKFEEIGWSFDLKAGATMQHNLRRIVAA